MNSCHRENKDSCLKRPPLKRSTEFARHEVIIKKKKIFDESIKFREHVKLFTMKIEKKLVVITRIVPNLGSHHHFISRGETLAVLPRCS